MKRKYKVYQCPFEDISCDQLDSTTLTLDCATCSDCEHYGNGVRFSKGVDINWIKLAAIALAIALMSLLFGCNNFNQPYSLRKFNRNQGKVVYDITIGYTWITIKDEGGYYYRTKTDTSHYYYVLMDASNGKFNEIKVYPEYHYYHIGDTLP